MMTLLILEIRIAQELAHFLELGFTPLLEHAFSESDQLADLFALGHQLSKRGSNEGAQSFRFVLLMFLRRPPSVDSSSADLSLRLS